MTTEPDLETYTADNDMLGRPSMAYLREVEEDAPRLSMDLRRKAFVAVFKRAIFKFMNIGGTDRAAALTYYAVLSLFPALIALVSMLGFFGRGEDTVQEIMSLLEDGVPEETLAFLEGPIQGILTSQGAGLGLVIGLAGALWTASGYVGAFSRALNLIYDVKEGRPIYVVRPIIYLLTGLFVMCITAALFMLTIHGSFAETIFDLVGIGEVGLTAWNWGKWPLILLIFILVISLLYQLTPNVRQVKFRILSVGGFFALVTLGVAVGGFTLYISNFGNYDATYGSLAGIIILLLLVWVANISLIFGALIDSERERSRMLTAGIEAERYIQLPLRSEKQVVKGLEKREQLIEEAAELRRAAVVERSKHANGDV